MSNRTPNGKSMLSAAVSRANQLATQGSGAGILTADGSGQSSPESLASFDHTTQSWKTSVLSLFEDSDASLETFANSGLMRNGQCFRRRPLVQHTDATGFSLLPTPLATDWKGGTRQRDLVKSQLRHWITCVTGLRYPNPLAYEAMMGFPASWTELEDSATPSSRKSRNGSAAG